MQTCQNVSAASVQAKASLFVQGLLNTRVIQSERQVTSPVPPKREICVRLRISLCTAGVYLSTPSPESLPELTFLSYRASQQWGRSSGAMTCVTFISQVGCKGPLQWREIRAAPCLLVFKWA